MKIDVLAAVETVNFLTMQKTDWSAFRHCYCWMYFYNRYSFCLDWFDRLLVLYKYKIPRKSFQ